MLEMPLWMRNEKKKPDALSFASHVPCREGWDDGGGGGGGGERERERERALLGNNVHGGRVGRPSGARWLAP